MENHQRHRLGRRAFALFLFRRIKGFVFFTLIIAALWYSERWLPTGDYLLWGDYIIKVLALVDLAVFLMLLLRTWLEYRYYTFTFTEDAFLMTRGAMIREEIATLYHQIQNVSVRRGPMDRLIGVSQIVIYMNGGEREQHSNHIVLPAVGKTKASLVQKELLSRARREHMAPYEVSRPEPAPASVELKEK